MNAPRSAQAPRLAVVDDSDEFCAIVRKTAEPMGWDVSAFANGVAFFDGLARSFRPDLIVLDMVMPEMDGIETLACLQATSVRCPVMLVTGRLPIYTRTAEELSRAYGLEVVAVLHKPVPLNQLRQVLESARPDREGGDSAD